MWDCWSITRILQNGGEYACFFYFIIFLVIQLSSFFIVHCMTLLYSMFDLRLECSFVFLKMFLQQSTPSLNFGPVQTSSANNSNMQQLPQLTMQGQVVQTNQLQGSLNTSHMGGPHMLPQQPLQNTSQVKWYGYSHVYRFFSPPPIPMYYLVLYLFPDRNKQQLDSSGFKFISSLSKPFGNGYQVIS